MTDRTPWIYWLFAAVLVAYVAACTGNRENVWASDSWEHHRVFKTLTENLWHPGNPTHAIDVPSARYSPYSVFWATVCRTTGLDPYRALSMAGTINTVVMLIGVPFLLARFGEARSSAAALLVMISLYGGIPGTTNSYAFSDLPGHMVNFSATSFAWCLIMLGVFQGYARGEWGYLSIPILVALSALTVLDHAMTGAWGQFSLWLFALTAPAGRRWGLFATVLAIQFVTFLACLAWPWYSFLAAMTQKNPPTFVVMGVQWLITFAWCVPAVVLSVYAFMLRDRQAIRVFLPGGYLSYLAGRSCSSCRPKCRWLWRFRGFHCPV